MPTKSGKEKPARAVAENRRARRDYAIDDTVEAGVQLTGSEVKSLRSGQSASIAEAHVTFTEGVAELLNTYIPSYAEARFAEHEERRARRLLLKRREIERLAASVARKGMTVIPLRLYFNARGRVKVLLGLGRGRRMHDKREVEKQRTWQRDKRRLLRHDS